MKYYRQYMDRQAVSADLHRRLLAIPESSAPRPARWRPVLAAAACCVLIVGAALGLPRLRSDGVPGPADQVSMPDGGTAEDAVGFLVEGSGETMMFPAIPYVAYPETKGPAMVGSIALPEGAFLVSLGVMALANLGGRANAVKLLLAGSALITGWDKAE